jgi:hypothetical protein
LAKEKESHKQILYFDKCNWNGCISILITIKMMITDSLTEWIK